VFGSSSNSNLSGRMVTNSGGINVVEVSKTIVIPLAPELQQYRG